MVGSIPAFIECLLGELCYRKVEHNKSLHVGYEFCSTQCNLSNWHIKPPFYFLEI
jgi:hypothetical protein